MPYVPYEPTDGDRIEARQWRTEPTLAKQWRAYEAFVRRQPDNAGGELPAFELPDGVQYERLRLRTLADARAVVVCEKLSALETLDDWRDAKHPSVTHLARVALAHMPPLPSRWTARTIAKHARDLGAPIVFVGDLDPQSVHNFAALRAGGRDDLLRGKRKEVDVAWRGIDSTWLDWLCRLETTDDVPLRVQIRLGWLDQEYWEWCKRAVPDLRRVLGARACALLDSGAKIEIDALISMYREPFLEEMRRRLRR